MGIDPSLLALDTADESAGMPSDNVAAETDPDETEQATIKLPEAYANVPYVEEYTGAVTIPQSSAGVHPPVVVDNQETLLSVQDWLNHVEKVLVALDAKLQEIPVTHAGFLSHHQSP